jgi:[glutamine synthetase] adenylyltransferase / [glutamine synthetase]-adenylyl-L-tyrosine phosphorylase
MLDVYFASRYLQLRDEVLDEGEDRSTAFTLERLRQEGSLSEDDFVVLSGGYSLLRSIDHNLRLIITRRSTRLPDPNHAAAKDVATRVGFESVHEMAQTLIAQMEAIRASYERILM